MTEDIRLTRIQRRNREAIRQAALEVFSRHGFRGATLDQIAATANMSKPNLLYYYPSKEAIHRRLMGELMEIWLRPLQELNPDGDPIEEMLAYVHRKLQIARDMPRESRFIAGEMIQQTPGIESILRGSIRPLALRQIAVIETWMRQGHLRRMPAMHLLAAIWALTQQYSDSAIQHDVLMGPDHDLFGTAEQFLDDLFIQLLTPMRPAQTIHPVQASPQPHPDPDPQRLESTSAAMA